MNYKIKYEKMRDLSDELICLCREYAGDESQTLEALVKEFEAIDEN